MRSTVLPELPFIAEQRWPSARSCSDSSLSARAHSRLQRRAQSPASRSPSRLSLSEDRDLSARRSPARRVEFAHKAQRLQRPRSDSGPRTSPCAWRVHRPQRLRRRVHSVSPGTRRVVCNELQISWSFSHSVDTLRIGSEPCLVASPFRTIDTLSGPVRTQSGGTTHFSPTSTPRSAIPLPLIWLSFMCLKKARSVRLASHTVILGAPVCPRISCSSGLTDERSYLVLARVGFPEPAARKRLDRRHRKLGNLGADPGP
jgi:hypothetical protein